MNPAFASLSIYLSHPRSILRSPEISNSSYLRSRQSSAWGYRKRRFQKRSLR